MAVTPFDAARARELQEQWAAYLGVERVHTNSLGMRMVLLPPGEFTMGMTEREISLMREKTPKKPGNQPADRLGEWPPVFRLGRGGRRPAGTGQGCAETRGR
jgi:hypothetical protein